MAGHRPVVFGQPFYAGWGLSEDRNPPRRRGRELTAEQVFAGAYLIYPKWFDHTAGQVVPFEAAARSLQARALAYWRIGAAVDCHGFRLWKQPWMRRFLGYGPAAPRVRFNPKRSEMQAVQMAWGTTPVGAGPVVRVEDGFIRSRGLGAALHPPVSLALDDLGIYYDPTRPSRLEAMIAASINLPDHALRRAAGLRQRLVAEGVSKYNLASGNGWTRVAGKKHILVVGQVADDASVAMGAGEIRTDAALLQAARRAEPEAVLVYKPHPDVLAGLRAGDVAKAAGFADITLDSGGILEAIEGCDAVWTMTSLAGFEALLRGKPVTCTGAPFYAGWGLTEDRGVIPDRRQARVGLDCLVHAVLIEYPAYFNPKTGQPLSVEDALDLLARGLPRRPRWNKLLARLQAGCAGVADFWR